MQIVIHPRIDRLQPYEAGERPEPGLPAIKLNQNECPYPVSPKVAETLSRLDPELLRVYPDASCLALRAALAEVHGLPPSMFLCGNGSSELITLVFRTFVGEGDTVALPDPTFGLYAVAAALHGAAVRKTPCGADFRFDPEALATGRPQAIVLANPNAPTGRFVEAERIESLLRRADGLVVVDEAYADFAPPGTSAIRLTERYDHLIVLRTFSKAYALGGARVGYAAANPRLIEAMGKGKETFSVHALSQLAAEAALRDPAYVRECVARIGRTRERFAAGLRARGWDVVPSAANFVLAAPPAGGPSARSLHDRLRERGIFVRHFDTDRLRGMLRISIGTDSDMDALLDALARLD